MISIRNAQISKPGFTLRIAAVDVRPGVVVLRGPNGSGKSTFFRALVGAEALETGEIVRSPNLRIGYVPQNYREILQPWMTGWANLILLGGPKFRLVRALRAMGFPLRDLRKRQSQLSGGQSQRIAVVREMNAPVDVLLLDEPFSGMDVTSVQSTWQLLVDQANARNQAVLVATHTQLPNATLRNPLVEIAFSRDRDEVSTAQMLKAGEA